MSKLPSAADLDAMAEEQRIAESTIWKCPQCGGSGFDASGIHDCSLNPNNLFRIGPSTFEALGDRVLVLVDPFKSGYECPSCGGKQEIPCMSCKNGHSILNPQVVCKQCHGTMKLTCPDCQGKGVEAGGIVVPDASQNRPESGTIVSVGEHVGMGVHRLFGNVKMETKEPRQKLSIGNKVLFGKWSGHGIDLETTTKEKIILRILNESEVLCRLTGHMELRRLKKASREEVL